MTYIEQIDKEFAETNEIGNDPMSKIEFIGSHIFDFTTYDSSMDEFFASSMLEVIEALLNKKTFEYQKIDKNHYINYLLMVNMPFLQNKLNWGTSIRGAWIECDNSFLIGNIIIGRDQIKEFLTDLIKWSKL